MVSTAKYLGIMAVTLGCLVPVRAETLVDTILARYGYPAFKQANEIRFTFAGKMLGMGPSRTWIWKPKNDSVTRVDKGFSYSRKDMSEKAKSLDKDFINDQYWLIFPLHLGMDKDTRIQIDSGFSASPKAKEKLRRVTVAYLKSDGYTPNDSYELFVTQDGLIKEWTYHKKSRGKGVSWTWEDYVTRNGVLFSQERKGIAHISFRDIEVK